MLKHLNHCNHLNHLHHGRLVWGVGGVWGVGCGVQGAGRRVRGVGALLQLELHAEGLRLARARRDLTTGSWLG